MKAEFAKAEDHVDDLLHHLGTTIDVGDGVALELFEIGGLREEEGGQEERREESHS